MLRLGIATWTNVKAPLHIYKILKIN